mmetsp:Transcript_5381/g.15924  ORF Transcript_5381/g.15924 Transcript_5381/m.15924 type:complete len:173 (+) Transcript_5381:105-623(+)
MPLTYRTPDRIHTESLVSAINKPSVPADFVSPRTAHRFFVSNRPFRRSALAALRQDRQISMLSGSCASQVGNVPYIDPELYSYGALPPMLNSSSVRTGEIFGIHPVDSIDVLNPSSLASQYHRQKETGRGKDFLVDIYAMSEVDQIQIVAWDSTVKQTNAGLWRPSERHRVI